MIGKKVLTGIIVFLIIAGLSLILYPVLSDYLKTQAFKRVISDYRTIVAQIDEETYDGIMTAAREYNERLAEKGPMNPELSNRELAEYNSMLEIGSGGVMCYVEIPKINISLPVYHGTGDAVLQSGIGHLEGTSLPIGGESTHSVLSGHRGLPSAQLFTNIDRLAYGDTFRVRVLNETLTYEVDQILTVLPYELDGVNIIKGEDLCTLLTCTPYGVNSHRLLVRGHRIETPAEEIVIKTVPPVIEMVAETAGINPLYIMIAVSVVLLLIMVLIILTASRRKRKKKNNYDND